MFSRQYRSFQGAWRRSGCVIKSDQNPSRPGLKKTTKRYCVKDIASGTATGQQTRGEREIATYCKLLLTKRRLKTLAVGTDLAFVDAVRHIVPLWILHDFLAQGQQNNQSMHRSRQKIQLETPFVSKIVLGSLHEPKLTMSKVAGEKQLLLGSRCKVHGN